MSFHDVRLPLVYSYESDHGVSFDTMIYEPDNKYKSTIQRRRDFMIYNIQYNVRSVVELLVLKTFYMCRRGEAFSFRFKDLCDYSSSLNGLNPPLATDQIIYKDPATEKFFLAKNYDGYSRVISKPVAGSVIIAYNGSIIGPSVNYLTGEVSGYNPANPNLFTAGFLYDVPVRFSGSFSPTYDAFDNGNVPLELREVLE